MKNYLFLTTLILLLLSPYPISGLEFQLTTSDNVSIACDFYNCIDQSLEKRLIIVSPGYAQHPGTNSMQALAKDLAGFSDVVILAYRGNGLSGGQYTFGADEIKDLSAVYEWGKKAYNSISILGFSLGAYTAFRFCAEQTPVIDKLLLVSCPSSVEDITLSGAAFLNPIILLFRQVKYTIEPDNDIWFRWAWPFQTKPNLVDLAAQLKVPVHFLIAQKDTLVYPELSRKVIGEIKGERSLKTIPDGIHAEHMYLQKPTDFIEWVKDKLAVSNQIKKIP